MGTPKFAGWFMSGKIPSKKMDDDWGHMMVVCLKCLPPFSTTTPKRLQWIFLHHLLLGGRSSFGLHRRRLRWGGHGNLGVALWRGWESEGMCWKLMDCQNIGEHWHDFNGFWCPGIFDGSIIPIPRIAISCNFPMLCSTLDLRSFEIRMALILRQI